MKYIIVYNECLRSKIIYYNFIKKNKSKILEVIRVPNLTKKKSGENSFFLIKKFIKSPICHKLYILIIVNLYLLINFFFKCGIEDLTKKEKINFTKLENAKCKIFLKKFKKDNFLILCSTSHILKNNFSKIQNIKYSWRWPSKYAGSSTYYYNVLNNEKFYRSSLILPNLTIDAGIILKKSKYYKIQNKSVFEVLLLGQYASSDLLTKYLPNRISAKNYNVKKKNFFSYSFPTKEIISELKKKNKSIFNFLDYFFLIKLIFFKNEKNFYRQIKHRLKL